MGQAEYWQDTHERWAPGAVVPPACSGCGLGVGWGELRWRIADGADPDGSTRVRVEPDGSPWHLACRRGAAWRQFGAAVREFGRDGADLVRSGISDLVEARRDTGRAGPMVVAMVEEGFDLVGRVGSSGVEVVRVEAAVVRREWRRVRLEGVGRAAGRWVVGPALRAGLGVAAAVVELRRSRRVGDAGPGDVRDDEYGPVAVVAPEEYGRWWFAFEHGIPRTHRVGPTRDGVDWVGWETTVGGERFRYDDDPAAGEAGATGSAAAAEGDPADPYAPGEQGYRQGWFDGPRPSGRGDNGKG